MKNSEYIDICINQLGEFFSSVSSESTSQNFFISKLCQGSELTLMKNPFRFDGYFAFLCVRGKFQVELNLRQFEINRGALLFYVPGNMVSLADIQEMEDSEFVVVAVARTVLQNAKVNFSSMYEEAISVMSNPCIHLQQKDVEICRDYYHLAEKLILASQPSLESSLVDLGLSLFRYLGSLWPQTISNGQAVHSTTVRSKAIFENFMRLVSENHSVEREVGFYANKMNISPKYLSQLVKKTSGQSAPDWISSFVILEAKNYLKYSNMDVKEIAYKLNFSSTPVFFRYFKAHTGMTPLEYRKS